MSNALHRLAYERAVEASVEVELQLRRDVEGAKPILIMLAKARREAAEAIVGLCCVDPNNASDVSALQNRVKVFDGIVDMITQVIASGHEAEHLLNADEQEDMAELIRRELAEVSPEIVGVQQESMSHDA